MLSSRDSRIGVSHGDLKGAALKINRSVYILKHYSKRFLKWCLGEVMVAWGFILAVTLLVGYAVGIWAIITKTPFASFGDRTKIAVGVSVGIPAFFLLLLMVMVDSRYPKWLLLLTLAMLLMSDGVGIGVLFSNYKSLSYSERVSIALGIGIGVPCVFLLWLWVFALRPASSRTPWRTWILLVTPFIVLVPLTWFILTKANLDQEVRVSLTVSLLVGVPALTGLCRLFMYAPWRSMIKVVRRKAPTRLIHRAPDL